jgi:hypothetical protein
MRINPDYMSDRPSPYIAPPQPKITVNVKNTFDRRGIATMVTEEQAKQAGRPNTGGNTFDTSRSIPSVGSVR